MRKGKWDNFTREEQIEILENSSSFVEMWRAFGYKGGGKYVDTLRELALELNADISKAELKNSRSACFIDLTNQKFGKLTPLYVDEEKTKATKATHWWCKCDCGNPNLFLTSARSLLTGNSVSCGCNNIEDLRGKYFGFLEPIEIDWNRTGHGQRAFWMCKCHNCNREDLISVRAQCLKDGHSTSCGCKKRSMGEIRLEGLLTKLGIEFEGQKTYPDLKGIGGIKLRFDFFLPKLNTAIEYQGLQHYKSVKHWGGEERFAVQQKNDSLKREYCKNNNISLIEIPYTDYEKLDTEYLLNKLNEVSINACGRFSHEQ